MEKREGSSEKQLQRFLAIQSEFRENGPFFFPQSRCASPPPPPTPQSFIFDENSLQELVEKFLDPPPSPPPVASFERNEMSPFENMEDDSFQEMVDDFIGEYVSPRRERMKLFIESVLSTNK